MLSYQVLHPAQERTLYLSTDGAGYVPLERLMQVPKAVIAFDQDPTAEEMAQRLMQDLPQASRHTPTEKDWSEDLQIHLEELQQRFARWQHIREDRKQINQKEYGGPAL